MCVFKCSKSQRISNAIKIFHFPKDPTQAKEWVKQSGLYISDQINDNNVNVIRYFII